MTGTFPNISIEEAKRQLAAQDRMLRAFPEVESVFGKVGRVDSATDAAPLTMVETTVRLKPHDQWRKVYHPRWYTSWAPKWAKGALGAIWPEETAMTWDELTAEMNRHSRPMSCAVDSTPPVGGRRSAYRTPAPSVTR